MNENMSHTVFQEDIDQEVDVVVQDKLQKRNITEITLSNMKERLLPIAANPITSKAELAVVQSGITEATRTRGIVVKLCKAGREHAIKEQRAWIAKEKEIVGIIEEFEEPLRARKVEWEAEQDRIMQEENAKTEARINARILRMEELGFVRRTGDGVSPDRYVLNDTAIELFRITTSNDDEWANLERSAFIIVEEIKEKAEAEAKAKAEVEAAAKAEADKQAAIAAENERRAAELEAQAKAIEEAREKLAEDERAKAEAEAKEKADKQAELNRIVDAAREAEVKAIGALGTEGPLRPYSQFTDMEWLADMEGLRHTVAARQKVEAEAKAKAAEEQAKRDEEIRVKAVADEQARIEALAKQKAEEDAEKLRQAGDKGVIEQAFKSLSELSQSLLKIPVKSKKTATKLALVCEHLDRAIAELK